MLSTKKLALITLFGVVVFLSKTLVPSPIDKMFVVVQALLLALGALLLRKMGATYVAFIGGVLTALWRPAYAPFTFGTALLYGLFVDGAFLIAQVRQAEGNVKARRLVIALTVSTALLGLFSYYVNSIIFGLVPRNPTLEVIILLAGALNGVVAGYLASVIWNKYLKNVILQDL